MDNKDMLDFIKSVYSKMIPIKALSPEVGGKGEMEKAKFIEDILKNLGVKPKWFTALDKNNTERPNLLGIYEGEDTTRTFWIVAHMDVVPEGDISLWKHPPFEATIEGDKVYGRGTEDDGSGIMITLGVLKYFYDKKIKPRINLGVVFVSDEETGSVYGMQSLMQRNIFSKNDEFLVPDWGSSDGSLIEIVEKHVLWLKIKVDGKQTHASTPNKGANANLLGMKFYQELYEMLHKKYDKKNNLFDVPYSTFEPTKKEANVPNINTIPGTDIQYFDCRILPEYSLNAVIEDINKEAANFGIENKCGVSIEIVSRDESPNNSNQELAARFSKAIEKTRNISPKNVGIGGGTIAKYTRKAGMQTIVWSTIDDVAHSPDEYAKLSNIMKDIETITEYLTMRYM
ncbi:MAG: M20 family metallo-hydrolase [Candidatus Micrarchaeia archaeon]